jgi:ABC-type Zn uptake system ZnuABC Zn-binding protein ZnuA
MLRLSIFGAIASLWLPVTAAWGEPAVRVVATTTVVADLVRQVGGDRIAVESLMAEGVDPHSYRATPRDANGSPGPSWWLPMGCTWKGSWPHS